MGTPVPPPPGYYPPGLDCLACLDILYPAGGWPLYMYATFFDIIASAGYPPPPNNYTFRLVQGTLTCTYGIEITLAAESWTVLLDLSWSYLWLYHGNPPAGYYFYCDLDPCSLYFPYNTNTDPPDAGTGGRALVRPTPAPIPSLLCGPYGFLPWRYPRHSSPPRGTPTFFESQLVAMDHELFRLANKADHSRCYFYIDREDIPPE